MSPTLALSVALCAVGGGAAWLWRRQRAWQREAYIREAPLPRGLYDALRKRRPELSLKDCQLVGNALRQFFLAHLKSGRRYVSMPSQVADDLWHEFILHTRLYEQFCQRAFGRFLHHTPAVVLSGQARQANAGLRRCWWHACLAENINPRRATRLPLLFALDAKLGVTGGFRYVLDCRATRRERTDDGGTVIYCGGDFGSPSFDGGTDGFGDAASGWGFGLADGGSAEGGVGSDGGGAGDGGGCGGGGCGGGGD